MPAASPDRPDLREPTRSGWSLWARVGGPAGLSMLLHAVALLALAGVVIKVAQPPPAPADREIRLTAAQPMRQPTPAASPRPEPPARPRAEASAPAPPVVARSPEAGPGPAPPPPPAQPASAPTDPRTPGTIGAAVATAGGGVSFAGLSAGGRAARSVVYVVDASGPMVTSLPEVLAEVRRSVDALTPVQRFGVVLFGDRRDDPLPGTAPAERRNVVHVFDSALRDATARHRARLAEFLAAAEPRGRSNPLDGLRAALALRPQVVFLLSRSIARSGGGAWELGAERTLAELDRLNPRDAAGRRGVIIKTIQFLEPDPTGIMEQIAREHGAGEGDHRVLQAEELGR